MRVVDTEIIQNLFKVQTYWQEYKSGLLAAAKLHRGKCVFLALVIISYIASLNGLDHSGLLATRDAVFTMLYLVLPISIVFSIDIDLVDFALKMVGDFFVLGDNTPSEVSVAKIKKYLSITHVVPLSPPRSLAPV